MVSVNQAYLWAVDVCNQDNVGYSQQYRNERTVNGIVYYDCSSFIWYALMAGGWDVVEANGGDEWPFTTSSMRSILLKLGFRKVSKSQPWRPGDILWRSGHTEMAYSSVRTMGAHTSKAALPDQVSINKNSTSPTKWTELYRHSGDLQDPDDPNPEDPEDPDNPPPPGHVYRRTRRSSAISAIAGYYFYH